MMLFPLHCFEDYEELKVELADIVPILNAKSILFNQKQHLPQKGNRKSFEDISPLVYIVSYQSISIIPEKCLGDCTLTAKEALRVKSLDEYLFPIVRTASWLQENKDAFIEDFLNREKAFLYFMLNISKATPIGRREALSSYLSRTNVEFVEVPPLLENSSLYSPLYILNEEENTCYYMRKATYESHFKL